MEPKLTSATAAAKPLNGIFALSNFALVTEAFTNFAVVTALSANFVVEIAPAATSGEFATPAKSPVNRIFPLVLASASTMVAPEIAVST